MSKKQRGKFKLVRLELINISFQKRKRYRFFCWASAWVLVLFSIIPVGLAIATTQAPLPQAILTLSGSAGREFTAQFAQRYPSLEIWVSSGAPPKPAGKIFQVAGTSNTQVHIDRRAIDTVTNFTSQVKDFKKRNFYHALIP